MGQTLGVEALGVVGLSFVLGAVPSSNVAARRTRGVDLRDYGVGTVSGSALYRVAGFGPLAVAGIVDVAKGAVGPLLAGPDRPVLAAVAAAAAVAGHNWSPILRGRGGRGIAPSLGALLARAWPGAALLGAGMVAGKVFRQTSAGAFVAEVALAPVLARWGGRDAALFGAAVALPMLAKRVLAESRPDGDRGRAYVHRLVFDHDRAGVTT